MAMFCAFLRVADAALVVHAAVGSHACRAGYLLRPCAAAGVFVGDVHAHVCEGRRREGFVALALSSMLDRGRSSTTYDTGGFDTW